MPRVTKSITAKKRHKKVLTSTKGHYVAVGYIKLQSNPILKHFNTLSAIGKIEKEHLDLYGYQELMPDPKKWEFHTLN